MTEWAKMVNIQSDDVIQHINKCYKWGLKHIPFTQKRVTFYFVPHPFELDPKYRIQSKTKIKSTKSSQNTKGDTKTEKIFKIKQYIRNSFIKLSEEDWDLGHMVPGKKEKRFINQKAIKGLGETSINLMSGAW